MTLSVWLDKAPEKPQEEVDIVIIGGGIVGAGSAFWLSKRKGLKVLLLESGKLAGGASGRNAGFVLRGLHTYYNEAAVIEDVLDLVAEVALHFEHESADVLVGVVSPVGDELLGVGIHAAAGLARADRPEDRNAGEESTFWDSQPVGLLSSYRLSGVVHFSEHQEEFVAPARVGVGRQGHRFDLAGGPKGEDVEA